MAIVGINPVARQQQQQPQQKKDLIDQILRGLQVAQGVTGIAVNTQKFLDESNEAPLRREKLEAQAGLADTQQKSSQFDLEQKQRMTEDRFRGFTELKQAGFQQVPANTEGATMATVGAQQVPVLPSSVMAQRATQKVESAKAATAKLKDIAKQNKEFGTFLKGRSDRLTLELRPVNSTVGDLNKALASLDRLDDPNLSGAEKIALLQAAQTNAARAVTGPGVLTETEFGRTLAQDYGSQIERGIFTKVKGDPTPADIASLRTIVETLATEVQGFGQNLSNNLMSDIQAQSKFFAPNLAPTDISPEAIQALLPGSSKLAKIRGQEERQAGTTATQVPAQQPAQPATPGVTPPAATTTPAKKVKIGDLPSVR
jgi:hypothetical protein